VVPRAKAVLPPLLILAGGLLALWGSDGLWGTCAHDPCEGGALPHLVTRSGFDFGTGVVTAVFALALVLVGAAALLLARSLAIRRAAAGLAIVEFILVSVHLARIHVFWEYRVYGPEIGLIAVLAGAAVSLAGAALLRPPRSEGAS
jgi:hypothetical protein